MNVKFCTLIIAALPFAAAAQISYTGGAYIQDFNTLGSGVIFHIYTTLPEGWVVTKGSYVWTTVTNGYSNNAGTYCFSSGTNDPDRSIGLVIGSTGPAAVGARFRNTSGSTLTSFSLGCLVKQWAKGAVTSADQAIPFAYSLDATNLASGTFVNVTALDMHSANDGDGVFAALNGNSASNQQAVAATVTGITWLPEHDLWIRWSGVSLQFNSSHALAIDDVSFSAVPDLQVARGGPSHLNVSWPTNYSGCILQSASSPALVNWDTVTNAPGTNGGAFVVGIEATGTQQFFRLKMH